MFHNDQTVKIKDAICIVPVSVKKVSWVLTWYVNAPPTILVKLNKKIGFLGHAISELVSLEKIKTAPFYLNNNNRHYKDITSNMDNVSDDLLRIKEEDDIRGYWNWNDVPSDAD